MMPLFIIFLTNIMPLFIIFLTLAWFFVPLICYVLEFAKILLFNIKLQKNQLIWLNNQRTFCVTYWVAANSLDSNWFARLKIKNKKRLDLISTRLNQCADREQFFVFCKQTVFKLLPNTFFKTCLAIVCFILGWVAGPSCAWAYGPLTETQYKKMVGEIVEQTLASSQAVYQPTIENAVNAAFSPSSYFGQFMANAAQAAQAAQAAKSNAGDPTLALVYVAFGVATFVILALVGVVCLLININNSQANKANLQIQAKIMAQEIINSYQNSSLSTQEFKAPQNMVVSSNEARPNSPVCDAQLNAWSQTYLEPKFALLESRLNSLVDETKNLNLQLTALSGAETALKTQVDRLRQQTEKNYMELNKLLVELFIHLDVSVANLNKNTAEAAAELRSVACANTTTLQYFIEKKTDNILNTVGTIGAHVDQEVDALPPAPVLDDVEHQVATELSVEAKALKFWRETLYELESPAIVNGNPNSDFHLETPSESEIQRVNNLYSAISVFNAPQTCQVLSKVDNLFLKKLNWFLEDIGPLFDYSPDSFTKKIITISLHVLALKTPKVLDNRQHSVFFLSFWQYFFSPSFGPTVGKIFLKRLTAAESHPLSLNKEVFVVYLMEFINLRKRSFEPKTPMNKYPLTPEKHYFNANNLVRLAFILLKVYQPQLWASLKAQKQKHAFVHFVAQYTIDKGSYALIRALCDKAYLQEKAGLEFANLSQQQNLEIAKQFESFCSSKAWYHQASGEAVIAESFPAENLSADANNSHPGNGASAANMAKSKKRLKKA